MPKKKCNLSLELENISICCFEMVLSRMIFVKNKGHETSHFHGYPNMKAVLSMASESKTGY